MRSTKTLAAGVLGIVCVAFSRLQASAQEPVSTAQPRLKIESFAASRAYAVGQNTVTLIATVRNVGDAPSAEGAVTGRLSCVTGLEYTDGDTLPKLPSLAPNATVNYRWRVTPNSSAGPLVAAFALEYPDTTPDVRVLGLQHFGSEPAEGTPASGPAPVARVRDDRAVLENGKVRARVESSAANLPGLWLAARSGAGWRRAGVSIPMAEVLSGEGGQQPWWEVFRAEEMRAVNGVGEASIILTGGVGIRWRATLVLTLRKDSSVLDADIRLSPLRPIKISGLRLGNFHAGDGGFGGDATEDLPYAVNGANAVAAVRSNEMTVGCSWPVKPLFRDWQIQPLTGPSGAEYQLLGAEMLSPSAPVELQPGALAEYHCRLYALLPTASVRQAFNIVVPSERSEARPAPPAVRALASRGALKFSTSRRALILRRAAAARRAQAAGRGKRGAKSAAHARSRSGKAERSARSKHGRASVQKHSGTRASDRKHPARSKRARRR